MVLAQAMRLGWIDSDRVDQSPFWHLVHDDWIPRDLYASLAESFPECPSASGPTGYTLFWGDPAYDALVRSHSAWRALFAHFHSQSFIEQMVNMLRPVIDAECRFDLSKPRYISYRETRDEKQRAWLLRKDHNPEDLWVRMDLMQGRQGYGRKAHLDHRRRLSSMLIYFSDPDETGMIGGDLVLHGPSGDRCVRPKGNRMALFPCHQHSMHSVTPIERQSAPRNFVQVTVSSSVDLWKPGLPLWQRALQKVGI